MCATMLKVGFDYVYDKKYICDKSVAQSNFG